jgi:L-ascorbate metabolism protein UlaG (beta-lactamase superfamily)
MASVLEIIPLGGIGEFGMNCMAVRYGDEMLILDAGMGFPEESAYGVDVSIPDFKFLDEYRDDITAIVLTHGHEDHLGDTVRLASKYGATVIAQYEICMYVNGQGIESLEPMNTGGSVERAGVRYTMVPAFHSSALVQDGKPLTMGDPAGFVIQADGGSIYHTGDTALFSDMALIQRIYRPKVGLICIGDRFTMGPETAAIACNEFLDLELIVPIHWGTFGLLSGRPEDFKARVTRGRVHVATPGEAFAV